MDYGRFQRSVYPALVKLFAEEAGIGAIPKSPFPAFRSLVNAQRFSREELTGFVVMLSEIDVALKSTGQDPRLLLEKILLTVCRLPTKRQSAAPRGSFRR